MDTHPCSGSTRNSATPLEALTPQAAQFLLVQIGVYLREGSPTGYERVTRNAEDASLYRLLRQWSSQATESRASAAEITALMPRDGLTRLARVAGLDDAGLMQALAVSLPQAVRGHVLELCRQHGSRLRTSSHHHH